MTATSPPGKELHLLDVLRLAGFDDNLPTKLIRHQGGLHGIEDLRRQGLLERYQQYQSKPVFQGCEQIIALCGQEGTRSSFYGVYRNLGYRARDAFPMAESMLEQAWQARDDYFYQLERDSRFDHWRDRLIVDWGKATRAWHQRQLDKPVIEILATGRLLQPFKDYLEFSLSFDELRQLCRTGEAHRDWQSSLSAVAGVYLILDESSGDLYVGSAYGAAGIWGRWCEYAKSGHGGNRRLIELIDGNQEHYPRQFRFSVLQILPKSFARSEVITRESLFKQKLGSRASGLNIN
jgi:hypothetical protein